MRTRQLKNLLRDLLTGHDLSRALEQMRCMPERRIVNPLFSFFYSTDDHLRWRAITAMGDVTDRLAVREPESARVIMRRLMWNLNDESGGIGWGSPEAMAEIMSKNSQMAGEYSRIFISYINPGGNYIEHEILQHGVLWGMGRLANARPEQAASAAIYLPPYMHSPDPILRGFAAWAAGPLKNKQLRSALLPLIRDTATLNIYRNCAFEKRTVGELASQALNHW